MPSIQLIYFDLGRVLLDFTHERGFRQIAQAANVPESQVRTLMVDEGLSERYEVGAVSTNEFHAEFCSKTGSAVSAKNLCRAWGDIFEIMPQSVRLAGYLRSAGYGVGILSNTCAAHWEYALSRFHCLGQLFHPIVTSYEAKSMKPDAIVYEVAEQQAGVSPQQIFFMDDREENVHGAQARGWTAAQFHSATQMAGVLEAHGVRFTR